VTLSVVRLRVAARVRAQLGAHIGSHTVAMAYAVQPGGVVHAFEPQRVVWDVLHANVELSTMSHTVVAHLAAIGGPASVTDSQAATASAASSSLTPVCLLKRPAAVAHASHGEGPTASDATVCVSRFVDVPVLNVSSAAVDDGDVNRDVNIDSASNFGGLSLLADSGSDAAFVSGVRQRVEAVPLVAVDEFEWSGAACPRLMKLDLEGMEIAVRVLCVALPTHRLPRRVVCLPPCTCCTCGVQSLLGSERTIARCRPILHVENNVESVSQELIPLLHSWSYDMYWEIGTFFDHLMFHGRIHGTAESRGRRGDHVALSVNLLALPSELPLSSLSPWARSVVLMMRRVDPLRVLLRDYGEGVAVLERTDFQLTLLDVLRGDSEAAAFLHVGSRVTASRWRFQQKP
jgi:hypothetical protein